MPTVGRVVIRSLVQLRGLTSAPGLGLILNTDANGAAAILPLSSDELVTLAAPWSSRVDPSQRGLTALQLGASPQHAPQVAVTASGAEPRWLASVWNAAMAASATLNKDLDAVGFSATAAVALEPLASAGAAAGFLAALTGAPADSRAIVLGILLPDGTIGPGPKLKEAIAAATASGRTRIGVPAGWSQANRGSAAATLQITPLRDLRDAYALLTHRALPVPIALPSEAMALTTAEQAHFASAYLKWQTRLRALWPQLLILQNAGRLPRQIAVSATQAHEDARAAEALLAQGQPALAYLRLIDAVTLATTVTTSHAVIDAVRRGTGLRATLDALATLGDIEELSSASTAPPHLLGYAQHLEALQAAVAGRLYRQHGLALLAPLRARLAAPKIRAQEVEDAAVLWQAVAPVVLALARGRAKSLVAREVLELASDSDPIAYELDASAAERLATTHAASAAAALAAIREAEAFQLGYLEGGAAGSGKELPRDQRLALAEALLAQRQSSIRLAMDSSLRPQRAPLSGRAVATPEAQFLASLLDNAARAARQHAAAASVVANAVPLLARLHYLRARQLATTGIRGRLAALEALWQSSQSSQLVTLLARNVSLPPALAPTTHERCADPGSEAPQPSPSARAACR